MDGTQAFLGVQRIAAEIGAEHSVLRRYAEVDDVVLIMSGQRIEGAQGNRFPASSLPLWKDLARLHKMRAITPVTAAQVLPIIWGVGGATGRDGSEQEAVSKGFEEICGLRIAVALERLANVAERALPPPMAEAPQAVKASWRRPTRR